MGELASLEWNLEVPYGEWRNVLEHLSVLAQYEPNQTYIEDNCEVSM